ncbi:MAG: co-chaperone YbbN [Alphaproteobacteria bacterium]|nr:co-chaperone YbbN [Alphaproteobacteria bacterium]
MADMLSFLSRGGAKAPGSSGAAAPETASQGAPAAKAPAAVAGAPAASDLIKDGSDATFVEDVLKASREVPVIVDLWAPWCGPCKTLGPIIEKAVIAARGAVRLVKVNVDENPQLSRQLRVQSIPAVYAFKDGQPVDGFIGALPESQVKAFIEGLVGELGPGPVDELLAEAQAARDAGDLSTAAMLYGELVKVDPGNVAALAGLAQLYLDAGDADRATQTLKLVPPDKASDGAMRAVEAALKLAAAAKPAGETQVLEARVAANPADHQARFDLAVALAAAGRREEAVDHLLEIVRKNRGWNDDAARKQLLTLFDAFGPKDEVTVSGRQRLSALLFA